MKLNKVDEVLYRGDYPNLCDGEWNIFIGEKVVICKGEMNTKGTYRRWYFDDNYAVHWVEYEDGLGKEEWVLTPPDNLTVALKEKSIEVTEELLGDLYDHLEVHDWRHNSCGGCI